MHIVLNFNNDYVFCACATMISILENTKNINVKFSILGNKITPENKNKLIKSLQVYQNFKNINFIDMNSYFPSDKFIINSYFSLETFYRCFIPIIFKNEKIIYVDPDMIVFGDLDMVPCDDDHAISAVKCYVMSSYIENNNFSSPETGRLPSDKYCKDYLKLNDINKYFQAGIIVFNNKKINEIYHDYEKVLLNNLKTNYWFLDQDILNIFFNNSVLLIDAKWNVYHGNDNRSNMINSLSRENKSIYLKACENINIIHYAGSAKPWICRNVYMSEYFWFYISKTIFIHDFIEYNLNKPMIKNEINFKTLIFSFFRILFPLNSKRRSILIKWRNIL